MFGRPKSMQIEYQVENRSNAAVAYTVGDRTFSLPPRVIRTHTRCRPAEINFQWPEGRAPASIEPKAGQRAKPADKGIPIESGTKYVIQDGPEGRLSLEQKPLEE